MQMYTATVEVAAKNSDIHHALEVVKHHHGSVGQSIRGNDQAIISLPAESMVQACAAALAIIGQALPAEPIACEVLTTAEHDARMGWPAAATADVVSVTEAAELLGVSRQRVLQLLEAHDLPGTKVGRGWTIPRSAVEARRDRG